MSDENNKTDAKSEPLDTERRILEAAEKEFLSKGFVAARTTAIAEAAGVTHAMLHYYFRSKEKLFSKVLTEKFSSLAEMMVVPFEDGSMSLEDCLRIGIEKHFEFIRNNPDLPRFMVCEVFQNDDLMEQLRETLQKSVGMIIGRLQSRIDVEAKAGLCSKTDARGLMMDIISLNVFPVLAAPMMAKMMGMDEEKLLDLRKQSNIDTILSKIKP